MFSCLIEQRLIAATVRTARVIVRLAVAPCAYGQCMAGFETDGQAFGDARGSAGLNHPALPTHWQESRRAFEQLLRHPATDCLPQLAGVVHAFHRRNSSR